MTNYKKRVIHDCLVPREIYQDLYLIMRERHKHLVDTWKEVTDPLKHVFEVNTFVVMHLMIFDAILGHWNSHLSDASVENYFFIRY